MPPVRRRAAIRAALVPAAARLSTPDSYTNPRQLIRVDGTPIIIHVRPERESRYLCTHQQRQPIARTEASVVVGARPRESRREATWAGAEGLVALRTAG